MIPRYFDRKMASPSKGRRGIKISRLDGSQKSITSFLAGFKKVQGTRNSSLKQENILPPDFARAGKFCHSNSGTTVKKKQSLLVPFDKMESPNGFKVIRMNRCHTKGDLIGNIDVDKQQNESGIEMIKITKHTNEQTEPDDNDVNIHNHHSTTQGQEMPHVENTFGLFSVSSSEDEELGNYFDAEMAGINKRPFSELPDEILENIFCQLPLVDLLVNMSVVSKRWYNVICNPKFLPWKKLYYRYKICEQARAEFDGILHREELEVMSTFPSKFSRFMSKFRVTCKNDADLLQKLRKHSRYPLIEKFQTENTEAKQSCWSTVGLLALVSSTVYEIQEIVTCSMHSSVFLLNDVIECLYCIALVFFALMERRPGKYLSHHYRIYYTLYHYENSSNCTASSLGSAFSANVLGQQCILKYRESFDSTWLTHEQVRIMNHNTKKGDVLKIVAFAGTGKTTTLVEYTKQRPSWKFLNVAYNKSVQQQAEKKFPTNVVSRTVHSLAFGAVGFKFKRKLASNIQVNNIMDNLSGKSANFLNAKRVADTLANFICSCDPRLSTEHVPYRESSNLTSEADRKKLQYFNSEEYYKIVVSDSVSFWAKMSDQNNLDVRITHDGYLKIYQLSKPVIEGYDCILIDEAQDCTPAVADILLNQSLAKILVGDPHQQIYGFRGATNAMAQVTATHTYYLTQSFRFGPEISSVASCLLDVLKGVRNKTIVGVVRQGGINGDQVGQLAIICRSNFVLFNNAADVCLRNEKKRIGFAGGIQSYNLDRILDIYQLYTGITNCNGGGIKDKFIRRFKTFHELKAYASKAPDPELLGKIKIVETHKINVPSHIERMKRQNCSFIDQAEIVFSTAHKAKGLEFDTVRLTEDFLPDIFPQQIEFRDVSVDEKNLLYVAVTRAKHRLQLPTMLYRLLVMNTDLVLKCEQVTTVENVSSTYCSECKRLYDFRSSYVAVQRDAVTLGTGLDMDGGFLCPPCVLNCVPVLGNMLCSGKT